MERKQGTVVLELLQIETAPPELRESPPSIVTLMPDLGALALDGLANLPIDPDSPIGVSLQRIQANCKEKAIAGFSQGLA